MKPYHKINTIFKRDGKNLIPGAWSRPEFEYLADNMWELTEKIDGTNVRIILDADGKVDIRGRTDNSQMPPALWKVLSEKFTSELLRGMFRPEYDENFTGACLYGEGFGKKTQKNGHLYGDTGFVLFDVIVGSWWLQRADVEEVAAAAGVPAVPVLAYGTLDGAIEMVRGSLQSVFAESPREAEGVVARPVVPLFARDGSRVIAKIKARDFTK